MSVISLLDIKNRNSRKLIDNAEDVRVSCFFIPSSFYLQLCKEDDQYKILNKEMQKFYTTKIEYFYCCDTQKLEIRESYQPLVKIWKITELKSKMNITVNIMNNWVRCITGDKDPRQCKMIDTGIIFNLSANNEKDGIYELERRFLTLPPRAILCGLGQIIPISPTGHCWTTRACQMFEQLTKNQHVRGYFLSEGLLDNTYYVFLTRVGKHGTNVHVNTALCAFDTAIADRAGLHHPIWPTDTPC